MSDKKEKTIFILGPTASGKTRLAVQLAFKLNAEIISADSRQVFRGMTVGTGKDLREYEVSGINIPYYLIDIIDAGEKYNLARYNHDFYESLEKIKNKNKRAVVCGGTGLYIESIIKGYSFIQVAENIDLRKDMSSFSDSQLIEKLNTFKSDGKYDTSTRKRIFRAIEIEEYKLVNHEADLGNKPFQNFVIFGLNPSTESRRLKISERLKRRFVDENLLEEAETLLKNGVSHETLQFYGLEYKYLSFYLLGIMSFDEMYAKLETEIHRFAKRQMTFFRSMEKKGIQINWIPDDLDLDQKISHIINYPLIKV